MAYLHITDGTILPAQPDALRKQLRQNIRQQRKALTNEQQQQSAQALVKQALLLPTLTQAQHIALYLANDGELDTYPLIQTLWQLGKTVYLPVMHPFAAGYLLFIEYTRDTLLYPNRFGIPEPLLQCYKICPIQQLQLIFTPLVAFDKTGNRLGMGGGFYDRTLSQLGNQSRQTVVGLAHNCQQVESVPVQPWDIPMQTIVTPNQIWHFS